jgi:ribosomal protein S18 acetylase RimI-like enzyme
MSIIYHSYFSEIDGYLFPDIATVCSDIALFKEFLSSNSIDHKASVIARVQGYPCGCVIGLYDEKGRSGLIGVVAVVPGMRRRGVGRSMLLHVMRWLHEHHHSRASLAVTCDNQPAISLYRSLGFEEVGPRSTISVWRRSVSRPLMNFRR